ncbi:lytic transglycosylase domain-containing protein [Burkholderia multivorans]|uniref:lytic transglycosylase domain-containing protein n=1 Tax=Burkholderia multivorans TaxID=87883 RepID=UPI000CFE92F9|nr:lytic transglycosylase domain-containing protein [Burkholderia multivorans]MCL4626071.1 lytic transglycosylase domain-containing protein [Burkholderia multivorans]PRG84611.1 lytic transglycosylase [Burkholderia multivorans]
MIPVDLPMLVAHCAPAVHPVTMQAVVHVESGGNPYAIGVVGGRLARQPRTLAEALATVDELARGGGKYSVGLAQVSRSHLAEYGLIGAAAFDACRNLQAGADILARCYARAASRNRTGQVALRDGLSCYYSGNFQTGYRSGYVQRVVMSVGQVSAPTRTPVVPAIEARVEAHEAIPVVPGDQDPAGERDPARAARRVRPNPAPGEDAADRQGVPDTTATPDNSAVVF